MITADFYTAFYVGVMVILAVINGIQLGASKGYPFRRFVNASNVGLMAVPVAFALGGQTSGFFFWTIIAFAFSVVLDAVELTMIYCGKIKPNDLLRNQLYQLPQDPEVEPFRKEDR